MVHPPQHMQPHALPPQGYQYDYSPAGMSIQQSQVPSQGQGQEHEQSQSPPGTAAGRALSSSKRAEQNRKAQRAFRERRDQLRGLFFSCFVGFLIFSFFLLPCDSLFCLAAFLIAVAVPFEGLTFIHRHVKALESRSQLLDTALASADEANRRWEECRALVDQLRVENTALRATLSNLQKGGDGAGSNNNGAHA